MDRVYWAIEGRLGGRCGPEKVPWDLRALAEAHVTTVISLTDLMVNESAAFHELGILHVCVPLPTSAPPKPGDKENVRELLPAACEVIERRMLRDGGAVLVHCGAGKDRTGLVLCYALMRVLGLTMTEAMARLKARRPDLLSAAGWWDMATQVLGEVPVFR